MRICTEKDCGRKHEARGLCKLHYNKAIRHGTITPDSNLGRPSHGLTEQDKLANAARKARIKYRRKTLRNLGYSPATGLSEEQLGEMLKEAQLLKSFKERKSYQPEYVLYANAKKRAKTQNVPFELEFEDIVIPEVCPCLGIPLVKGIGIPTDNSPTLDKVIPEKGYVKGNVWVISMRANRIKDNASLQELESIASALRLFNGFDSERF